MKNIGICGPFTKNDIGPRKGRVFTEVGVMAVALLSILACVLIIALILWHGIALSSISAKIGKADFVKSSNIENGRIEIIPMTGYPPKNVEEEVRIELKKMPEHYIDPMSWICGHKIVISEEIPDEIKKYPIVHKKIITKNYSGRRRIL